MGQDLRIHTANLPNGEMGFSNDEIHFNRNGDLFFDIECLSEQKGVDIPTKGVEILNYRTRKTDPYGDKLKHVSAGELSGCLESNQTVKSDFRNKAILAYLKCLPEQMRVLLYWY